MRFKEPDIKKERRRWPAIQEPHSRRRYMHCACILGAEALCHTRSCSGIFGHVLQSSQNRGIASRFERMHDVLLVVIERKAAMGQSEHAAAVGTEPGEQGGTARGTGGRSTEGFAKHDAFHCQALKIRE